MSHPLLHVKFLAPHPEFSSASFSMCGLHLSTCHSLPFRTSQPFFKGSEDYETVPDTYHSDPEVPFPVSNIHP